MGKILVFFLLLIAVGVWLRQTGSVSAENLPVPEVSGPERVRRARAARQSKLEQRCAKVGLPFPPRELLLRAFKQEGELEVWGREDAGEFRQITTYRILTSSGQPGPKRREGDRQVPEGFYLLDQWNPTSKFHLSLRIDYPNAADRQFSDPTHPGGDIYIHGSNRTVGCLPLGDDMIEELYILTLNVHDRTAAPIPIHLFPRRMTGPAWEQFSATHPDPQLRTFWNQIKVGYHLFEQTRRIPLVTVAADGSYQFKAGR